MEEACEMTFGTCGIVYGLWRLNISHFQPNIPLLELNVTVRRDDVTLLGFTFVKIEFFVI